MTMLAASGTQRASIWRMVGLPCDCSVDVAVLDMVCCLAAGTAAPPSLCLAAGIIPHRRRKRNSCACRAKCFAMNVQVWYNAICYGKGRLLERHRRIVDQVSVDHRPPKGVAPSPLSRTDLPVGLWLPGGDQGWGWRRDRRLGGQQTRAGCDSHRLHRRSSEPGCRDQGIGRLHIRGCGPGHRTAQCASMAAVLVERPSDQGGLET